MLAPPRPSTGPRREGAGERPRAEPADADRRIYTYSVPSSCMPSRGGRLFTPLAREQAAQSTARPRAAPRTALAALSRSARLHSVMGELCGDRTACRTSSARTASTSPRAPPAPSCSSQTCGPLRRGQHSMEPPLTPAAVGRCPSSGRQTRSSSRRLAPRSATPAARQTAPSQLSRASCARAWRIVQP